MGTGMKETLKRNESRKKRELLGEEKKMCPGKRRKRRYIDQKRLKSTELFQREETLGRIYLSKVTRKLQEPSVLTPRFLRTHN